MTTRGEKRKADKEGSMEQIEKDQQEICSCGEVMEQRTMELPGNKDFTIPVNICPRCGRHKYIKTTTFLSTRLADVEPVIKKVGYTGKNCLILIPKSLEKALGITSESLLEMSVEGFDRLTIRILHKETDN
jgi:hypothetical protein